VRQFIVIAIQSIGASTTTFVSQNIGAQRYERARKGVSISFKAAIFLAAVMAIATRFFCSPITRLFGNDTDMLYYARLFVSVLILLQVFDVPMLIYAAALRGEGRAATATLLMILGLVGVRQLYLCVITRCINTPITVGLAFPVGWLSSGMLLCLYYRWIHRSGPLLAVNGVRKS
jgi:Na+-driven multidrug efflux pump